MIGGAAHNFGVAPMLWRGIGIGPIADAVALVFPEHGRDKADSDRSAGRVGADCFGGERVKAVAFLQSVRLLNRQLSLLVSNDVAYWPLSSVVLTQQIGSDRSNRWGNRPTSLWIAEDFWVLRFRLMVKRGPR